MRYRKIIGRAAAFLSAAALIGAGPETAAFAGQRKEAAVGENWQESGESQAVPYAGRNYEGIDLARLEQLLAQLEQACQGLTVLTTQEMGRRRSCTVRGGEAQLERLAQYDVEVAPVSLQGVFVALCGHGEEV